MEVNSESNESLHTFTVQTGTKLEFTIGKGRLHTDLGIPRIPVSSPPSLTLGNFIRFVADYYTSTSLISEELLCNTQSL